MFVAPDTSWFDEQPETWLEREDFIAFQEMSGVDFRDLLSDNADAVRKAQEELAAQSHVCNEIRRHHTGFRMPLLYYTHDMGLACRIPRPNAALEKICLASDLGDSLRRRHIALSHAILPCEIRALHQRFGRPIVVMNLGSGVGLDAANAVRKTDVLIDSVLNYDIDKDAVDLGVQLAAWLERRGEVPPGVIQYKAKSFASCRDKAHLVILVGVICGMTDAAARDKVLPFVHSRLEDGARLVVSSSNVNMREADPLFSFLIQHVGTPTHPHGGWGLNFRTRETMHDILAAAGFRDIAIYDDADYPGRDALSPAVLSGVDPVLSEALGRRPAAAPISLPPHEVLARRTGYNWIAVAGK